MENFDQFQSMLDLLTNKQTNKKPKKKKENNSVQTNAELNILGPTTKGRG